MSVIEHGKKYMYIAGLLLHLTAFKNTSSAAWHVHVLMKHNRWHTINKSRLRLAAASQIATPLQVQDTGQSRHCRSLLRRISRGHLSWSLFNSSEHPGVSKNNHSSNTSHLYNGFTGLYILQFDSNIRPYLPSRCPGTIPFRAGYHDDHEISLRRRE